MTLSEQPLGGTPPVVKAQPQGGTALVAASQAGALFPASAPFLMAPMAGVTDAAYRTVMRRHGAALAYTEMVSVAGLHYGGEKTWELVLPGPKEPQVAVQLFGHDPEQFREASALVSERLGTRLALIDVNMACPMPKVTKGGAGSALLDEPKVAAAIVHACAAEASVPVTVKIRRGRRMGEEVAPDFARAMEQAGAQAVAVHGRYANQLYRGEADWDCVRRVAEAVTVPVIGSGDVSCAQVAVRMLADCGCSAVMVARGTYGNPWVFSDALAILKGEEPPAHGPAERVAAFADHVRLLDEYGLHMAKARSLSGWYLRGMPQAAAWRSRAMACSTAEEFLRVAEELAQSLTEGDGDQGFCEQGTGADQCDLDQNGKGCKGERDAKADQCDRNQGDKYHGEQGDVR